MTRGELLSLIDGRHRDGFAALTTAELEDSYHRRVGPYATISPGDDMVESHVGAIPIEPTEKHFGMTRRPGS